MERRHGFPTISRRERGITILAKCTSVQWKDIRHQHRGHPRATPISAARSSGILSMVDGVVVLVDAAEGPACRRPSSVTGKALRRGLRPIVLVNKCEPTPTPRPHKVHDAVFDSSLFGRSAADDNPAPISRRCSPPPKQGWAAETPGSGGASIWRRLFEPHRASRAPRRR